MKFSICDIRTSLLALGILGLVVGHSKPARAQQDVDAAEIRFVHYDVYVEAEGGELAAYQFEFLDPSGRTLIVGVEGGEHAAFKKPPYYDSKALKGGRLIVAAFQTGDDLPVEMTRVARLHLQITGDTDPDFELRLMASASKGGEKISATIKLEKGAVK